MIILYTFILMRKTLALLTITISIKNILRRNFKKRNKKYKNIKKRHYKTKNLSFQ